MSRRNRLAILVAASLVVGVAGSALAMRAPTAEDGSRAAADETEPSASDDGQGVVHALDRLGKVGIEIDEATLRDLAATYGVGGATRIAAWAADPDDDVTIESIRAMRDGDGTPDSGMGWGQIARELGVHPGLGAIMGGGEGNGNGHGNGNGNGNGQGGPPVKPDATP